MLYCTPWMRRHRDSDSFSRRRFHASSLPALVAPCSRSAILDGCRAMSAAPGSIGGMSWSSLLPEFQERNPVLSLLTCASCQGGNTQSRSVGSVTTDSKLGSELSWMCSGRSERVQFTHVRLATPASSQRDQSRGRD